MANWRMAFRDGTGGTDLWEQCRDEGVAVIQYNPLQDIDLSKYAEREPRAAWEKLGPAQKHSLAMFAYEMRCGDVIYVKQGKEIVGRGTITGPYTFVRNATILNADGWPWQHERKVEWEKGLMPVSFAIGEPQIYTVRRLTDEEVARFIRNRQGWRRETRQIRVESEREFRIAEEIAEPRKYTEGAKTTVVVNAYERNPAARAACISHFGNKCCVCGFDFGEKYGPLGEGFIHVHHLRNLASIGKSYKVDPISDLRPVCPNCHAMLHRRPDEDLNIDQLQKLIRPKHR